MYRVIERLKLGRHRYGKYRVEYSIPWIDDAKNIYLVSIFTSYFPGRIKLVRKRGRGYAVLDLYEGVYPYFFVTSNNNVILDEENPLKTKIRIMPEKNYVFEASLSIIGLNEYKKALGKKSVDPRFIIHDEKDQAFIHKYLEYIVIRIYTLRDMFKQACLIVEGYGEICNNKLFSDKYRDYYQFILKNTENNIQYLFKLRRENNEYYFFGREGLDNQEYIVPDKIEGIRKPAWWIGAVYYQIFPDSFSRFPREFTIEECLEKRKENLLGGNIEGILKKIPYIVDLGVNAIYFTPIYRASSYHRYDVI
ncbi:MAG: alpha-amylase family glycosyl hydrolase, partial [Thermoprotei archaeon]